MYLLVRLLLSAVFLIAGITKLLDRAGTAQAIEEFGAPVRWARPLAVLLPVVELCIGLLLLPVATAWWGALGALALLMGFIIAIVANLARGRRPDCHCFGQLYSAPIGTATLMRNGVLALLAGWLVWQGPEAVGPSLVATVAGLDGWQALALANTLLLLVLAGVGGWFLFNLLQQNGRLLLRIEALEGRLAAAPAGSAAQLQVKPPAAPELHLPDLNGQVRTWESLRRNGEPLVLLFTNPTCAPCRELLPEIAGWEREYGDRLTFALVSKGTAQENQAKRAESGVSAPVLLPRGDEAMSAFGVTATPSAVVIRPDGTLGSSVVAGPAAIRGLVQRITAPPAQIAPDKWAPIHDNGDCGCGQNEAPPTRTPQVVRYAPERRRPAPELVLPDLAGAPVDLAAQRGQETVVLFWSVNCGYCQRMLPDLRRWEDERPAGAPGLVVVSRGDVEANRRLGLHAPVLLDSGAGVSQKFGAAGTPTAVLVDAEGRIASSVAVGAEAVMALLNPPAAQPAGQTAMQTEEAAHEFAL